jgi:hypothetical protein
MRPCGAAVLSAVVFIACPWTGFGQTELQKKVIPTGCTQGDAKGENAVKGVNLEEAKYLVRSATVVDPFAILPWVKAKEKAAQAEISDLVDHEPFRYATAVTQALDIINEGDFLPGAPGVRIRVWLDVVTAQCSGNGLDLVYHVYSTQVLPSTSGTPEGQVTARQTPQVAAGLSASPSSGPLQMKLLPKFGFDRADKVFAGGQLDTFLGTALGTQFHLLAEGQGSQQMNDAHVALDGSRDSVGPIIHADYRLNFDDSSLPTGLGALRQVETSLQYSAITQTFFGGNLSGRFGALLEKGNQQADLHIPPALGSLTASPVNALKLYAGIDSRLTQSVLSASFGFELGSTGVFSQPWKKYIGDVRHEYWRTLGDHHFLDLESRFAAGDIQIDSRIPLTERFFGGSYEQMFIPDDAWQIRANPVIRAIPGSFFYETAAGPGGTNFLAYNLTAALGIWRRPLAPPELSRDQEFQTLLKAQLKTATSMTEVYYLSADPSFAKMVQELPAVITALDGLLGAVNAAQHSAPADARFKTCASAVKMASRRAADSKASTDGGQQYGRVSALLTVDPHEDRLDKVINACRNLDPRIDAPLASVDHERETLETEFSQINQKTAERKASDAMAFVGRTLHTLFYDMDLYSISPVAVFDAARMGPVGPGFRGARYGPGAGLRLDLADSVNFTVGYAWNAQPGPGEGSGAVFFSMGVRDLFH